MRALAPPASRRSPSVPARRAAAQRTSEGVASAMFTKRGIVQRGTDGKFLAEYQSFQGWARRYTRQIGSAAFAAGVTSDCCARCEVYVEERTLEGEWVKSEDPRFVRLMETYGNDLQGPDELVRMHSWHYQVAGEMVQTIEDNERGGVYYGIYSVAACEWDQPDPGLVTIKLVPDGKVDAGTAKVLPKEQVTRFWLPDQEWFAYATSPMAAVIDDLHRHRSLARYAMHTADSYVAMNGMLWAPGEAFQSEGVMSDELDAEEAAEVGTATSALEESYYQMARMRFDDSQDVTGIAPPLFHWDKDYGPPEWVQLGNPLDPNGIAYRQEAIEDFARGTNLPVTTVVGGGIGQGNHWSEWLATDKFFDSAVAPTMDRITHLDLTRTLLWPRAFLEGVPESELGNFRIGYDPTPVIVRPDNSATAISLYSKGVLATRPTLEACGFDEADQMISQEEREWLVAVLSSGKSQIGGGDTTISLPDLPVGPSNVTMAPPNPNGDTPVAQAASVASRLPFGVGDTIAAWQAYSEDQARDELGRFGEGSGDGQAHLTSRDYEGEVGNREHITRTEEGTIPTRAIATLEGVKGEVPGEHRNYQGDRWEAFKADIAEHGIQSPIFVTVDRGEPPKISEGNQRRDAAVELGLKDVPIQIRYFGHAEEEGTVAQRAGVQASARLAYSEDQARDELGRFGEGDGTSSSEETDALLAEPGMTPENPIQVDSASEALELIGEGKFVEMDPEQVSILIDELSRIAQEAKERGEAAGVYNLCNISVPDSNLFCGDNIGVPRFDMPQLVGDPQPGTLADSMERNRFGEVDTTGLLLERLRADGHEVTLDRAPADQLKATQNELNGTTVAGIMHTMETGGQVGSGAPIIVSRDNYVVDGTHRWAATVGEQFRPGDTPDLEVLRLDMPISEALLYTTYFSQEIGIGTVPAGATYAPRAAAASTPGAFLDWVRNLPPDAPMRVYLEGLERRWATRSAAARLGYSEDQERDEFGRFAGGGDTHSDEAEGIVTDVQPASAWAVDSKADADARLDAYDKLESMLPNATVNLGSLSGELAPQLVESVQRATGEFPGLKDEIKEISVGVLRGGTMGEWRGESGTLVLNEKYMGNTAMPMVPKEEELRSSFSQGMRQEEMEGRGAFHPLNDAQSVIDHELGHAVWDLASARMAEEHNLDFGHIGGGWNRLTDREMSLRLLGYDPHAVYSHGMTGPFGTGPRVPESQWKVPTARITGAMRTMGTKYGAVSYMRKDLFGEARRSLNEGFAEWFSVRQRPEFAASLEARTKPIIAEPFQKVLDLAKQVPARTAAFDPEFGTGGEATCEGYIPSVLWDAMTEAEQEALIPQADEARLAYSEDQPRDEQGRFGEGSGEAKGGREVDHLENTPDAPRLITYGGTFTHFMLDNAEAVATGRLPATDGVLGHGVYLAPEGVAGEGWPETLAPGYSDELHPNLSGDEVAGQDFWRSAVTVEVDPSVAIREIAADNPKASDRAAWGVKVYPSDPNNVYVTDPDKLEAKAKAEGFGGVRFGVFTRTEQVLIYDPSKVTVKGPALTAGARLAYSEDQARDELGRFGEGQGEASAAPSKEESGPAQGIDWANRDMSGIERYDSMSDFQREQIDRYLESKGLDQREMTQRADDLLVKGMNDPVLAEKYTEWYERNRDAINEMASRAGISEHEAIGLVAACSIRAPWDTKDGEPINLERAEGMARAYEEMRTDLAGPAFPTGGGLDVDKLDEHQLGQYMRETGLVNMNPGGTIMSEHAAQSARVLRSDGTREGVAEALRGQKISAFAEQFEQRGRADVAVIDTIMGKALSGDPKFDSHLYDRPSGPGVAHREEQATWQPGGTTYAAFDRAVALVAEAHGLPVGTAQALIWGAYRGY